MKLQADGPEMDARRLSIRDSFLTLPEERRGSARWIRTIEARSRQESVIFDCGVSVAY